MGLINKYFLQARFPTYDMVAVSGFEVKRKSSSFPPTSFGNFSSKMDNPVIMNFGDPTGNSFEPIPAKFGSTKNSDSLNGSENRRISNANG